MSDAQSSPIYADDEIDIRELFAILWEGKLFIASCGIAAMLSVIVALSMPKIYRSTAILAPKSDGGTGGLSRLASQYSGLASLAGINLGGVGGDGLSNSAIALEKMKSLSFFETHLYEDMLIDLMAVESWNSGSRLLEYDGEIFDEDSNEWTREVSPPLKARPSAQKLWNS